MASIRFDNISKSFGDVLVLADLNFDIKDHEFIVFVGPSGCGKSTALRIIAGLEEITSGKLYIDDRVVNDVHPKDRDTAMVFQSYALYPHMSVRENISFGLRIRKLPKADIAKAVDKAAAILGLEELLDRKPKALSGGQRQRVALGRAIVRNPSVFLFDEPLSNLDAELRVHMRAELSKLQSSLKTTTVYVTHDQVEAMTLGHRIAVLAPMGADGKSNLKQIGTPLELYDSPQNLFVARFIGTPNMNVMTVRVNEDGRTIEHPSFRMPVPAALGDSLAAFSGQHVALGVRPENVGDPAEHDWPRCTLVRGEAEIVETIGHEVQVHIRSGEDIVIAKLGAHRTPTYGEEMELAINTDRLHFFDLKTEQRIGARGPEATA